MYKNCVEFMTLCLGLVLIIFGTSITYVILASYINPQSNNCQHTHCCCQKNNQETQQQEHPCEKEEPCLDCDEKEGAGLELEEALQMYPLPTPDPNMNINTEKGVPILAPPKPKEK